MMKMDLRCTHLRVRHVLLQFKCQLRIKATKQQFAFFLSTARWPYIKMYFVSDTVAF
jgi:hypothetical protein